MPSLSRFSILALLAFFVFAAVSCHSQRGRRGDSEPPPVIVDEEDASSADDVMQTDPDVHPVDDVSDPNPELPGEPCGGCPSGEVCVEDVCQPPSEQCPCAPESYCDLAENRCLPGCITDDDCAAGRICEAGTRTCRNGCRDHDACPPQQPVCDETTSSCREGCLDHADCSGQMRCSQDNVCTLGCLDGEPMVDGGCLLHEVCGIATNVYAGGDCSVNHDDFAHWWCELAGYDAALSYEVLWSGSFDAVYYSGGETAVLSECDQVNLGSYGVHSGCTAVGNLICAL